MNFTLHLTPAVATPPLHWAVLDFASDTLPILIDAAIKGSLLLVIAAGVCLVLRNGSAANRHLVWLSALCAAAALPGLALVMPGWRVLPASMSLTAATTDPTLSAALPSEEPASEEPGRLPLEIEHLPGHPNGEQIGEPAGESILNAKVDPALNEALASSAAPPMSDGDAAHVAAVDRDSGLRAPTVVEALAIVWSLGAAMLLLTLGRGAWVLGRLTHSSQVVVSGRLAEAVKEATAELGVACPKLYQGAGGAMPMVWGVFAGKLLLPLEADLWRGTRLRAVLLHEVAHLRRRDPLTMAIAHLARAVHWYNPLVWFAVRSLQVEQEQACDDCVLRAGVVPSEYAEHVLDLAANLRTPPGASAVALTMAQPSRLEGRLLTILSAVRNRSALSTGTAVGVVLVAGAFALSLAALRAAEDPPAAAGQPSAVEADDIPTEIKVAEVPAEPRHESARQLLKALRFRQRSDLLFPVNTLRILRAEIEKQLKAEPGWRDAEAARDWLKRTSLEQSWKESELISLLDEAAGWSIPLLGRAELLEQMAEMQVVKPGRAATAEELETLPFGPALENGLRVAWIFNPVKAAYTIGDVVKCRIIFHNHGQKPVEFTTDAWHQYGDWTIKNPKGEEVQSRGVRYTGLTPTRRFRLEPGQVCEVAAHGAAFGEGEYEEEFSTGAIGKVIAARAGEDLTFVWTVPVKGVGLAAAQPDEPKIPGAPGEAGAPGAVGVPGAPSKPGEAVSDVQLQTGLVKVGVVAADPNAPRAVRVASQPGRYLLRKNVKLQVSRTSHPDGRFTNSATILWFAEGETQKPQRQHPLQLADGLSSFLVAWIRETDSLWILEKSSLRHVLFGNAVKVTEERWDRADVDKADELPQGVRKVLESALNGDPPASAQAGEKPSAPVPGKKPGGSTTDPSGIETTKIKIKNLDLTSLLSMLRKRFPNGAELDVDKENRQLIVNGTPEQFAQIQEVVRLFDRDEKGPMVLGLDLSTMRFVKTLGELPDLYELEPAKEGQGERRYAQRPGVFVMPLDEQSWLYYAPEALGRWYIVYRDASDKPETERTYGPFVGDPFKKFKLDARMIERLRKEYSPDDLYRIKLMLRTKVASLERKAMDIMEAALQTEAEGSVREQLAASFREVLTQYADAPKTLELLGAEVRRIEKRIAEIEADVERLTAEIPDSEYQRPDPSKIKVPEKIDKDAWGKPVEGLRLAVVFSPDSVKLGEATTCMLVVENVSEKTIKFSASDLMQGAHAAVNRLNKEQVETKTAWYTGLSPIVRYLLKPGEQIVVAQPSLMFVEKADDSHAFGRTTAIAPPGVYLVNYTITLGAGSAWARGADGVMRRVSPAKGEWSGTLTSGLEGAIHVARQK